MQYTSGAVVPFISRSKEEPLWSDYVLRTEFRKGEFPHYRAEVKLIPPKPIKITEDFDTVAIWRFATQYGKPRPALSYSIQYRDSAGNVHTTGNMGGMLENGWGIHMKPLQETVKAPAEIVSLTFWGFNEERRVTYFDSLHVYKRPNNALTEARVMSWKALGVPVCPNTIMPTAAEKGKVEGDEVACRGWGFTAKAINRFDTPELYFYQPEGVFVFGVENFSPAARSGLYKGDIILKINDQVIRSLSDLAYAYDRAGQISGGSPRTRMTIMRNGVTLQLVLYFSKYNQEML